MAQRSLLRPDQLDSNGNYSFAQLVIDGYSGGDLMDGYLTGLILTDSYVGGSTTIEMDAHTGAISQLGTGQVSFAGNVDAANGVDVTGGDLNVTNDAFIGGNVVITGDLTVNGTETIINTDQMYVTDPITIINASGSELNSDWTGLSARDGDGYNRTGWVFTDVGVGSLGGYFGLSVSADSDSDATPDRAIAYLGAGDAYGDLSSTLAGNSGAGKIGVNPTGGIASTNVQAALEELSGEIAVAGSGTTNVNFTINTDATAGVDENSCLIQKGGDGTSLIEGYMCLITDSVAGDRWQLQIYEDATRQDTDLHLGPSGLTDDIDALLTFNAGDGSLAQTATIKLDGTTDSLVYTADQHTVSGPVRLLGNEVVDGYLYVNGNVVLGDSSLDSIDLNGTITSDLIPTNNTYYVGSPANRWVDGYFDFFTPTNYNPAGSNWSLEGHLKGIDEALGDVMVAPPRGVYVMTAGEATSNSFDSARATQQGDTIDVSGLTDAEFMNYVFVYRNGQLLYNDSTPRLTTGAVLNDVARKTGDLKTLLFSADIRKGDIIQIVDMR